MVNPKNNAQSKECRFAFSAVRQTTIMQGLIITEVMGNLSISIKQILPIILSKKKTYENFVEKFLDLLSQHQQRMN